MTIRNLLGLFLLLLWQCVFGESACADSLWYAYLKNPTIQAGTALRLSLAKEAESCDQNGVPSATELPKVRSLIRSGSDPTFRAAIIVSRCMGVGDLEDFYRAAGEFLERKPSRFIEIVDESKVSDREILYMVTMLPISFVDALDAQIEALDKRILKVEAVTEPRLSITQRKILKDLKEAREDLTTVASEEDSASKK